MYFAELSCQKNQNETFSCGVTEEYLRTFLSLYSSEQILAMPFWLERMKSEFEIPDRQSTFIFERNSLNDEQMLAFRIVENNFNSPSPKQLRMILTGQGGSGKSYLIGGLRNLLGRSCVVLSYFGIAAFNVQGQTLHSFFQLPIHGKNTGILKGNSLAKLQHKITDIKCVIIDEYSVIGQRMMGCIDSRCRQATGLQNELFGGLSVILTGDVAQLPPCN